MARHTKKPVALDTLCIYPYRVWAIPNAAVWLMEPQTRSASAMHKKKVRTAWQDWQWPGRLLLTLLAIVITFPPAAFAKSVPFPAAPICADTTVTSSSMSGQVVHHLRDTTPENLTNILHGTECAGIEGTSAQGKEGKTALPLCCFVGWSACCLVTLPHAQALTPMPIFLGERQVLRPSRERALVVLEILPPPPRS